MENEMNKTSDFYSDLMYERWREKNIIDSQDLVELCELCQAFKCTDGAHYIERHQAVDHQYNLLRRAGQIVPGQTFCDHPDWLMPADILKLISNNGCSILN